MQLRVARVLLVTLSLLSLLRSTSAWSTGSGTCNAAAESVTRQTGRHPLTPNLGFYLDLPVQYKAGAAFTVTIANSGKNASTINAFNGFLLYATDAGGQRVGKWDNVANVATTDMLNAVEAESLNGRYACYGADAATITHSTGGAKKIGTQLIFTPPDGTPQLTFHGLVEFSSGLYYTQLLNDIRVCPPDDNSCTKFDPSTLPNGPLPTFPTANASAFPFGLEEIDQTACGSFTPIPYAVVPPGFCASLYTVPGVVNRPRGIYITDNGDMLVVETGGSPTGVSLLRDLDGDGVIQKGEYTRIFNQAGLNHGLYVHAGFMYISSPNTVWRVPFNSSNPAVVLPASSAVIVVKGIPGGGHSTRTPLVSHDGRWLYVSIGSAGNLDNDDSRSRVVRYDLSRAIPSGGWQWNDYTGSNGAVQAFAKGLRNEVGLTLDLQGDVWGCMNADDNLNRPDLGGFAIHNDNPAERVDHLRESNMATGWYGYPYCWAADILAGHQNGELFGWGGDGKNWWQQDYTDDWCRANTVPASYALQAHTAPLGLLFYDGRGRYAFPGEYFNQIFLALHGSWNSDTPRGYKVTRIGTDPMGEALASTSRDFLAYRGPGAISNTWPHKPADVRVGPHGELFISSPDSSQILVVRYNNPERSPVTIPRVLGSGYNYTTIGGPTRAVADFTFDRRPANVSNPIFRWMEGERPHTGLAFFDGVGMFVNATRADNGAGVAAPNVTGGTSSYETWLQPASLPEAGRAVVVWELMQPAGGVPSPQDGWIRLLLSNGSLSFEHRSGDLQRTDALTLSPTGIRVGDWAHVVVVVNQSTAMPMVQLYASTADAGLLSISAPMATAIPVMARRSALIGRPYYASYVSPTVGHFHGYIDAFRIYSIAVSTAQVRLSYQLQSVERIEPALQLNLHQQPMESSEVKWTHMGPSSRYHPTASTFFPGWAAFNGSQYIDLLNPGNSVGNTWRDQLRTDAFSVEIWFRARSMQTGAFSILAAPPLLRIDHTAGQDPSSVTVRRSNGMYSLAFQGALSTSGWTQLVVVITSNFTMGWVNSSSGGGASNLVGPTMGAPTMATLGDGFDGEVAILRVFDTALTQQQAVALYNAQMAEQGRPLQSSGDEGQASAEANEEEEEAPLSFAGIVGVVVSLSVLITAAVVAYLWYTHRKAGLETGVPSTQLASRLLGQ